MAVRQRWLEDCELAEEFITDVGQFTGRMQRTVESLLALSPSEANATIMETFDELTECLNETVDSLREQAERRKVSLPNGINAPAALVLGRDEWPVIVFKLMDNAIEYSERDSTVFITLQADCEKHELQLTITVEALNEHDLPHLLERPGRKDTSRTSSLHCESGLVLVKACATRAGASVDCQLVDETLRLIVRAQLINSTE